MTPTTITTHGFPRAADAPDGGDVRLPDYPRITDVLERMRAIPTHGGEIPVVDDPADLRGGSAPTALAAPAPAPAFADAIWDGERRVDEMGEEEIDQLASSLALRDIAREALRARLIAIGAQREHRSTYELVFLMLAFAVMVMIVSPPLVQLAQALRGGSSAG